MKTLPKLGDHPEVADLSAELTGDDRPFTYREAESLAFTLGFSIAEPVIDALRSLGHKMVARPIPTPKARGILSNPHDRWHGPGSAATHGGSGADSVAGFAGNAAASGPESDLTIELSDRTVEPAIQEPNAYHATTEFRSGIRARGRASRLMGDRDARSFLGRFDAFKRAVDGANALDAASILS